MNKKYLCTRMSLASKLIESGENATNVKNPFNQNLTAWEFEITPTLIQIATEYYKEIGKAIPSCLVGVLMDE